MALSGLGAARPFLDSLEFVQEFGPSNIVTTLAAGAGRPVKRGCSLGRATGTHEYVGLTMGRAASWGATGNSTCVPAGTTMEKTDVADAVQSVLEGGEGGALGEEHEDTVEAFVQVGVSFGFEELEAKV